MSKKVSDNERFIMLCIFAFITIIYFATGFIYSDISPIIKLIPYFIIAIYLLVKSLKI